jgi:predicted lipid-binding transport protein (Tim44 family)
VLTMLQRRGQRLPRGWRQTVSLGLGVPLLLGSTPAAAAGSGGLVLGGVAPWLGLLAALWALLAPRKPADLTGAATLATFGAIVLTSAVWRWRRQRSRRDAAARGRSTGALVSRRGVGGMAAASTPAGLDGAEVLEVARSRFMRLQAAWDAGDVQALGHLTTPEMLRELLPMLTTRTGGASRTDVITLHAELVGLEELGAAYLASVEFSGLIRESAEQGAVPFRELWMLACEKDGSPSWRLARQQALF